LTLIYSSSRHQGGREQLYVARRPEQFDGDQPVLFEEVELLSEELAATGFYCAGAKFSADDSKLYFSCWSGGRADIYVADIDATGDFDFQSMGPVCGDDLNTPANESYPSTSADQRAIFFSETLEPFRPNGRGNTDIWFAWRDDPEGCFGTPVSLEGISTDAGEWSVYISPDWPEEGSKLYFCVWRNIFVADWIPEPTLFLRGDCNDDGTVNISDATCTLEWLFAGAGAPGCVAALNTNGDAKVDIADPVALLNFLFGGGPVITDPFPDCGPGTLPADAELGCANPPVCQ
jgi:hypothetical protein